MEAHAQERRETAARDSAAWELKRDAGIKAYNDRLRHAAAAATTATAAATVGARDEMARRTRQMGAVSQAAETAVAWAQVIETHHPGNSLVHPLATFSPPPLGAVPAAVRAAAGGAPLPPPPPRAAFTLSLDVSGGGAAVAAALEWAVLGRGGGTFTVVAIALVSEDATRADVLKVGPPQALTP
jgi:hypothetical protein